LVLENEVFTGGSARPRSRRTRSFEGFVIGPEVFFRLAMAAQAQVHRQGDALEIKLHLATTMKLRASNTLVDVGERVIEVA